MTKMTIERKRDRIGASRGKLALVGVLSIVLVVVIVVQLPDSQPTGQSAKTKEIATSQAPQGETKVVAQTVSDEQDPPREWPKLSLDVIADADPFAWPTWYQAAASSGPLSEPNDRTEAQTEVADKQKLEDLQKTGAAIVLITGDARIATIGDKRLRVGDRIEGYEVSEITSKGVILTKARSF